MVKLRFKRKGRRKSPFYRLVAIDSRKRRDGREIERLGWYDPIVEDNLSIKINEEKTKSWIDKGAIPSDTVKSLIKKSGLSYKWSLENNFRIVLLTTKSKINYTRFNFTKQDILLFGKESAGVPEYVHNQVHEKLTIPMQKGLRSLNISSSVAMVMGEASRQLNLI